MLFSGILRLVCCPKMLQNIPASKEKTSFQYFAWHSLQRVVVSVGFHPIVDFGYRNVWQFPMDAFGCFNEMKWNGHRTDMMEWI